MGNASLCALVSALFVVSAGVGHAADRYEEVLVQHALETLERDVDPAPEGKRVREILISPQPIITPDDPYPAILNAPHFTTQPHVIERELLFAAGEPWSPPKVEETERNLRRLPILAVARIVPLLSEEPGTVDALVVTKDLWSIRFNSSFNLVGTLLQYLRIRPTEQNLFGLGKQLSLDFELRLDTVAFGQELVDPRLFGSRWALEEQANLIFNRATNRLEGSEGLVRVLRPLYSLETEWGADLGVRWMVRRERLYRGPDVWELPVPGGGTVPWIFDRRDVAGTAFYTRSFGTGFKVNTSAGLGAYRRSAEAPPGLEEAELEVLRARVLPRSEDAAYVGFKVHAFEPAYRVTRDLMTFSLTEDYQVGPRARVELRLGHQLDEPAAFVDVGGAFGYRVLAKDALFGVSVAARGRYCPERCAGVSFANRALAAEVLHVSPFVGPGRIALRGLGEVRQFDLDNTQLLLGGGNGLRGTRPELLTGTRAVLFNVEYRTRPWVIRTLHLGGVLFWDAGAVFEEQPSGLTHTVGVGLRALFPQFDVEPLRIDFGYVIEGPNPSPTERVSSSFGQVTRYRPKLLDQPLD